MPIVDSGLQANLLKEIKELHEKRARLEADIKALDTLCKHRMEKAALQDIDAYRNLHLLTPKPF